MTIFEKADAELLPGFERRAVTVNGNAIMSLSAGNGPPLLMLHGDPQTHLCWHRLAPRLAERFTVVLTDLRGRGESHKPGLLANGNAYSKREMAEEQRAVMRELGHERFAVIGHDRGARVARRLALDHPGTVSRLVAMDIIPALNFYEAANASIAQDYFYFFFLTQDHPIPDDLIKGNAHLFMRQILFGLSDKPVPYAPAAVDAYLEASTSPDSVTAMCECFRAGFKIDPFHDEEDRKQGKKITCPTLVMWGEWSVVGRHFDVEAVWSEWSQDPAFAPVPSGHFIPEEAPEAAFKVIIDFLTGSEG